MKRVYVVFESSSDNCTDYCDWIFATYNYEDKFIEVYDNYQAAVQSIKEWAEQQENVISRKSNKDSEEVRSNTPHNLYFNEDVIWRKREIRSTLLKSS